MNGALSVVGYLLDEYKVKLDEKSVYPHRECGFIHFSRRAGSSEGE